MTKIKTNGLQCDLFIILQKIFYAEYTLFLFYMIIQFINFCGGLIFCCFHGIDYNAIKNCATLPQNKFPTVIFLNHKILSIIKICDSTLCVLKTQRLFLAKKM